MAAPLNGYGSVGIAPQATVHVFEVFTNDQGRVGFRWEDGNAYDVEIADYH